ncbi:Phenylalanine--tRNA ligase, mitochondrial [Strongyloides ratti]|uniref:phenylalanine--tRNA ligase n=1 Tax=Strongyloides ratti TaxID=34506 RepID=A0A090MS17_STRRB|nr:Phenylalanine--tRNA ligase, mitochondrial [Strongyloides ratti]CEF61048.1 Phenylalanine--tRNA ligase, mitochondrial [Strongyloides ratti]
MHKEYRKPGNRSPTFTVCENEPRIIIAHTSAHQFEIIKRGLNNFLVIGDVYRRDEIDKTHYPCFHQMEGVRIYEPDELYGDKEGPNKFNFFENGERTNQKQECHTIDATKILEFRLKNTLENICRMLFGNGAEIRWVEAYFPFTHPSYELEVFYEGKWLEVLGCGIIEQKLLQNAGCGNKVGWAFGLGLERLAMILYKIPDIRLFWSKDTGFLSQFKGVKPEDNIIYKPISSHPQLYMDISFWLPENISTNDMTSNFYDIIRSVGGDIIEQVSLMDEFFNKNIGKTSQCYRITYRSNEKSLTKEEVNNIHTNIGNNLINQFNVVIR